MNVLRTSRHLLRPNRYGSHNGESIMNSTFVCYFLMAETILAMMRGTLFTPETLDTLRRTTKITN